MNPGNAFVLINRYLKTADSLRLELIARPLPGVVNAVAWGVTFLGPAWFIAAFLVDSEHAGIRFGVLGGFVVLFVGRILSLLAGMLKSLSTTFVFDLKEKRLQVESGEARSYPFLPKTIPFSNIETLQLRIVKSRKATTPYLLELTLDDGKFIPITGFKSETRVRAILRDLQIVLDKPVNETHTAEEHRFRDYKRRFLEQFEPRTESPPP